MRRVLAWVLLAATVVLTVGWVVLGQQESDYRDLRTAVAEGEVDEVTVYGVTAPYRGRLQLEVRWRSGPFGMFQHIADVTEQHPQRAEHRNGRVVVEDVGEDLLARDADLTVVRHNDEAPRFTTIVYGRPVPTWVAVGGLAVGFAVLLMLIGGPQPWRATKWAWFWLIGAVPPLGIAAFLLLGGSTGVLPPQRPEARLTGGWAFLLAFVVNSVAQTIVLTAL